MKALFIDPIDQTIRTLSYDGDYKSIYRILDCTTFECVYPFNNEDTVFIDEEGLLKESNFAFNIRADNPQFSQTLFGKALVLGTDAEGESVEVKSTLEEVESKIRWIGKVAIYHGQTGFEIVPIEADVEEAKNSIIREEVNKTLSKIFNEGRKK